MPIPLSLSSLIGVAVTPVVLVTATAIALSGYTAKYSGIAEQMRRLSGEYRRPETSPARRVSIKQQLRLDHRRITAMWAGSALLSLALLAFIGTVVSSIFAARSALANMAGIVCLLGGLALLALAFLLELYEIRLARLAVAGELADVFAPEQQNSP